MFRLVAVLWWFGLVFHFGIAFFVMIAGSQGIVPAAVEWVLWGTLVLNYFVRRRVMGRWLYRLRVKRARYWQSVNRDAARGN